MDIFQDMNGKWIFLDIFTTLTTFISNIINCANLSQFTGEKGRQSYLLIAQ